MRQDREVNSVVQTRPNPEVEGRTHPGWPPKRVSAGGDGTGVLRAQELLSAKNKAKTKRRKTSFCFGNAKTDRTPSIGRGDTPGNLQKRGDNWNGGTHKIEVILQRREGARPHR